MLQFKLFFVASGGKCTGPFTGDQLQCEIEAGKVTKESLVWGTDIASWQPISLHFSGFQATRQMNPPIEGSRQAASEKLAQPRSRSLARWKLLRHPRLCGALATTVALLIVFYSVQSRFANIGPPSLAVTVWVAIVASVTLSSAILAMQLWKSASLNGDKCQPSSYSGLMKVTSVFCGVLASCYGTIFLSESWSVYNVSKARDAFNGYELRVDPVTRSVTIAGPIGPNLGQRLADALYSYPNIESIFLSSPGGLVDEALDAARTVEAHPNIRIFAKNECNSACIIVLLSAQHKYAEGMMALGFHAISPITRLRTIDLAAVTNLGVEADRFLRDHQVPDDIINRTNEIGPTNLNFIPSIKLAELGVLTGVTFDDTIVSISNAKWLYVENKLDASDQKEVGLVFSTIRRVDASVVDDFADQLYNAAISSDPNAMRIATATLIGPVRIAAINSAEPDAITPFIKANARQLEFLRQSELWDACKAYALGTGGAELRAASTRIGKDEVQSLASMIESASRADWVVRPLPSWAEKISREAIALAAKKIAQEGIEVRDIDNDPKSTCVFYGQLMSILARLDPVPSATIMRWVIRQTSK